MKWWMENQGNRSCKSMRRIACIAKPATSWTLTKLFAGCRRKAAGGHPTIGCDVSLKELEQHHPGASRHPSSTASTEERNTIQADSDTRWRCEDQKAMPTMLRVATVGS